MLPYRPISPTFAIVPTVSVIIPARNEAANLPHVFRSLPPWVNEIIVVDGHSVDDTVAVAHELCPQAQVITQPGRGKGDALIAGFVAATGDILVAMDADGSTDGAEIIQFVGALVCGADYAKGSRFSGSGGSSDITAGRRYGNWLLGSMVNRMFRTQFTDLCYGYNAFWARHLDALGLDCPGFEIETMMNIRAAKAGPAHPRGAELRAPAAERREQPVRGARRLADPEADPARAVLPARGAGRDAGPGDRRGSGRRRNRSPGSGERGGSLTMLSASVIICAHADDRWDDTLAAVASVHAQSHPAKELIVVIDYNRPLYERLKAALPEAMVIENDHQQGLSGGRNTGIAAATGQVVAFLDDDAIADVNWLKCMIDAYTDASVAGVGGRTLPSWDSDRPAWFPEEFDWVIGCTYIGMPTRRAPVRNLLGGNASFRREVFDKVGGFTSGIGRGQGKRPLGCEETEFCIRLNQQLPGSVLLFDEQALIWHRVRD